MESLVEVKVEGWKMCLFRIEVVIIWQVYDIQLYDKRTKTALVHLRHINYIITPNIHLCIFEPWQLRLGKF